MSIFRHNNGPDWIQHLPDKPTKLGLIQLARGSSGEFDKPREMNISLYGFLDEETIKQAKADIEKSGWSCTTQRQEDYPQQKLLTATKIDYRICNTIFMDDINFFKSIAAKYNAGFDGWFAST